ncbi:MAG: methyltransferase [Acidobacteria bacterium]|jgi:2-polyprenyl-3-methyl-5-hydroxy-6-metoxy-1,4-benzoquinol methylase|nr:methyltransferase [Acidobacteriota bacterium]
MEDHYKSLQREYAGKQEGYYDGDRRELLRFIPMGAKTILDIGCGSGNFGQMVKRERDCIFWGVEPNREAAERAKEKLDKVINDAFSDKLAEIKDGFFDVICFNDVLEHLVNPEDVLSQCRGKLTGNGIIVASIPNVLYYPVMESLLIRKDWQYQDAGVLDKTHLRFFTKKSIVRMFEDNGYEVIAITGINNFTGFRYKIINIFSLNLLKDWKYMQFVVQAKNK